MFPKPMNSAAAFDELAQCYKV